MTQRLQSSHSPRLSEPLWPSVSLSNSDWQLVAVRLLCSAPAACNTREHRSLGATRRQFDDNLSDVRIALIGYGYWGPNYARVLSEIEGSSVAAICDAQPERLSRARERYPQI